ncbi:NAD(P)-binding domain-containing protein [Roseivirga sp. E12]|uniref:NAD(P)-binding domain-containing protein n=1 Tax=Roseivirga sp. E12 TaxID=2819237 RepID=UPI001ABD19A1|nr:NAD(P)-binding domain-containing protein [Roseivirga sp. E12]MBO3699654.1 epimerase [Roseivirga sp. E12]
MKIGIVGCGWLGLPLAQSLVNSGHKVIGSTTSEGKMDLLSSKGIEPVLFRLNPMPEGIGFNRLFQVDLLIINIPPGRKKNTPEFYEEQIKYLKYQLQSSTVKEVIFISSTSYYPNNNASVDVNTAPNFDKGSSKAVVKGEGQISEIKQALTILRCGGLMGNDRIPGKWFAGKPTKGADTKVNYIHLEDIINTIGQLIDESGSADQKQIFNLVSDHHPTRKEVHEKMAAKYGFDLPIWEEPSVIPSKIVESSFKNSSLKSPLDY